MRAFFQPSHRSPTLPSDLTAATATPAVPTLSRAHARRLRDVYRSAGWPCLDAIEVDLLAAGLLCRVIGGESEHTRQSAAPNPTDCTADTLPQLAAGADASFAERVRLTDAGIAHLARAFQSNRQAISRHNALVQRVAQTLLRDGRVVWTSLSLRARLPAVEGEKTRWKICKPDVFSIRNTSVAGYLEPIVHEIKVNRADLLGDLKSPDKRSSYLDVGGQCWYVLGYRKKGEAIAEADEIPLECGVMLAPPEGDADGRLQVLRNAPKRPVGDLPFALWMALAKSTPLPPLHAALDESPSQAMLGEQHE